MRARLHLFLEWGIRANSVHPAQVSGTSITAGAAPGYAEANAKAIPAAHLARPGEVMQTVLFLASYESSYVNGSVIVVDSGYTSFGMARMRRLLLSVSQNAKKSGQPRG